jgi:hypothetical protein
MKNILLIFTPVYKVKLESNDNQLTRVAFYRGTKWGAVEYGNKLCRQKSSKYIKWFVDDIRKVY